MNKHMSLFSGAGGLDIGLKEAGFGPPAFRIEKDRDCFNTLEANTDIDVIGISQTSPLITSVVKNILGEVQEHLSDMNQLFTSSSDGFGMNLDLISGGPPCQSFSTAGKRQAMEDDRGKLIMDFLEYVKVLQPRFFVMENVKGLTSASIKHRPLNERGNGYPPLSINEEPGSLLNTLILPAMEPYQVMYGVLNALDYGSPQHRERLIFIGSRNWELPNIPMKEFVAPTHKEPVTLMDAIGDIQEDPGEYQEYSPARKAVYECIPAGKNWRFVRDSDQFDKDEVKKIMGGAYNSSGGRVGFWRRLSFDKWSPTLTTSPIQKATGLCHPVQTRPLSIKEYARIQGFPDSWEFKGSLNSRYKQIGNAVPIPLGKAIGTAIKEITG